MSNVGVPKGVSVGPSGLYAVVSWKHCMLSTFVLSFYKILSILIIETKKVLKVDIFNLFRHLTFSQKQG